MDYVVTIQRETYLKQETKIIIEVPSNSEQLDGIDPADYAADIALQLASGGSGDDDYEDEKGNITRGAVEGNYRLVNKKIEWKDIETDKNSEDRRPYIVATRKFKPTKKVDNK